MGKRVGIVGIGIMGTAMMRNLRHRLSVRISNPRE
jgi:hypothetical protein